MKKPKVIVICGPTASGKTKLSIELAKTIDGEIVSCDSMQIYKDMNIGTAKVTKEEAQGVKHYLVDFISPDQRYSVANYKKDATNAIEEILKKGKVPIVVGGTGLYVDSLIYNIDYAEIETDLEYRKKLEKIANTEGLDRLYEMAKKIDEKATLAISCNDKKRIIRILEIYHSTGRTKTEQEIESRKNEVPYNYIVFAINMDREKLYDRINRRVNIMLEEGLIEEVELLLKKYKEFPTAMQGLGYKEVIEYINGHITKEEMIEKIKSETRKYAKRQLTWFRKNKQTIWLNGLDDIQNNLKIIFMGTPSFAVPALKKISEKHQVVLVVTREDKRQGRGKKLAKPEIKICAEALGLEVYQPEKINSKESIEKFSKAYFLAFLESLSFFSLSRKIISKYFLKSEKFSYW